MTKLVAVVASSLAVSAWAANFVVNENESKTIEADATYDAILCNGTLTIAPGVTVNATRFVLASNGVERAKGSYLSATCTVGEGAKVVLPIDKSVTSTFIGIGPFANATLVLEKNADFCAGKTVVGHSLVGNFNVKKNNYNDQVEGAENSYGKDAFDFHHFVHLKEGAVLRGAGTDVTLTLGASPSTSKVQSGSLDNPAIRIRLDKGAYTDYSQTALYQATLTVYEFNGGKIRQGYWQNSNSNILLTSLDWWKEGSGIASKPVDFARIYLKSVDGNDIRIERAYYGKNWMGTSYMGSIWALGAGDIVLTATNNTQAKKLFDGTTVLGNICYNNGWSAGGLRFDLADFTGNVRIEGYARVNAEGLLKYTQTNSKFTSATKRTVTVKDDACVNLSGLPLRPDKPFVFQDRAFVTNVCAVKDGSTAVYRSTPTTITNKVANVFNLVTRDVSVVVLADTLTLGAASSALVPSLSVTAGAQAVVKGNSVAVKDIALDGAGAVAFEGDFRPESDGTLALSNYSVVGAPSPLPITYGGAVDKSALKSVSVTLAGAPYTELPLCAHKGRLYLGRFGMFVIVR